MFKKVSLIIFLSVLLGGFLILRPYLFKKATPPRIEDRLPEGDFIGRVNLLEIARESKGMLYKYEVPFRDLLTHEFILSQSKNYGLNLQKPVYFFGNEDGEWGSLISVTDSSKIFQGIERLQKVFKIKDTLINDDKVYHYKKENLYLCYDKNFMLVYKGTNIKVIHKKVTASNYGDIAPVWKSFLREAQYKNEYMVLYSNWPKMKESGVDVAMFAHDSDSTHFSLKSYVRFQDTLNVKMKAAGKGFKDGPQNSKILNIHLDVSNLRNKPNDPLFLLINKLGKRIGFPTNEFLNAWEGDLSFHEGGVQTIKESYIESELDENFNVTEVEKVKDVKIPGFSMLFSSNNKVNPLIGKLMTKGILTKDQKKFRFLYSPPLYMNWNKNIVMMHSGQKIPATTNTDKNHGTWIYNGVKVKFSLDSLSAKEAFGTLQFPVQKYLLQFENMLK